MKSDDIEKYLAELGEGLKSRGIKKPVRMMLIGGAYMLLLANAPRTTDDIDIFWLEEDDFQRTLNPLRESVQTITNRYTLDPNWFNYVTQLLIFDEVIVPHGKLWKRFGPLYIHIPSKEYILALKIMAGRDKDIDDCVILLPQTKIRTRQHAQQLLDRYILPEGREKNIEQIANALDKLFGEK